MIVIIPDLFPYQDQTAVRSPKSMHLTKKWKEYRLQGKERKKSSKKVEREISGTKMNLEG